LVEKSGDSSISNGKIVAALRARTGRLRSGATAAKPSSHAGCEAIGLKINDLPRVLGAGCQLDAATRRFSIIIP